MTRATARHLEDQRRRERRAAVAKAIAAAMIALALMGLAGEMDLHDRTEGLGASMVPSAEWRWSAW